MVDVQRISVWLSCKEKLLYISLNSMMHIFSDSLTISYLRVKEIKHYLMRWK